MPDTTSVGVVIVDSSGQTSWRQPARNVSAFEVRLAAQRHRAVGRCRVERPKATGDVVVEALRVERVIGGLAA